MTPLTPRPSLLVGLHNLQLLLVGLQNLQLLLVGLRNLHNSDLVNNFVILVLLNDGTQPLYPALLLCGLRTVMDLDHGVVVLLLAHAGHDPVLYTAALMSGLIWDTPLT